MLFYACYLAPKKASVKTRMLYYALLTVLMKIETNMGFGGYPVQDAALLAAIAALRAYGELGGAVYPNSLLIINIIH